jgi:hypothetical protein
MRNRAFLKLTMMMFLGLILGCSNFQKEPAVPIVAERSVQNCEFIETLAENSDPGKNMLHPKYTYDAQNIILMRAAAVGATHAVWLYNYPIGSAAMVYRCDE